MSEIELFKFEGRDSRIITDENGDPWFVAKDVLEVLEYNATSTPASVFLKVPAQWKGIKRIDTLGGTQDMLCLSEQGLYFFLGRSDKPKALPYQMKVAGEVMPDLRKHGAHITEKKLREIQSDPRAMGRLFMDLADEQDRRKAAEEARLAAEARARHLDAENTALTNEMVDHHNRRLEAETRVQKLLPAAMYTERVLLTKDTMTIDEVACDLGLSAIKLNRFLEKHKITHKRGKSRVVYQEYRDKGYFDYVTTPLPQKDGTEKVVVHLQVKQSGRKFITEFVEAERAKGPLDLEIKRPRAKGKAGDSTPPLFHYPPAPAPAPAGKSACEWCGKANSGPRCADCARIEAAIPSDPAARRAWIAMGVPTADKSAERQAKLQAKLQALLESAPVVLNCAWCGAEVDYETYKGWKKPKCEACITRSCKPQDDTERPNVSTVEARRAKLRELLKPEVAQ
jgi:prophage antirepressor-like protein